MEPVTTAVATAPWWGPAALGAAGALGTGLLSSAFNMREAEKNRDFQERMSSTAHQRQVADLKEAGLNPLLSANKGASSPGGAQATASMPDVVNSAVAMAEAGARIKDINSAAALKEAQRFDILKTLSPRVRLLLEQRALAAGQGMVLQPQIDENKAMRLKIRSEAQSSAYNLSQQKAESQFYEGMGEFMPYIEGLRKILRIAK